MHNPPLKTFPPRNNVINKAFFAWVLSKTKLSRPVGRVALGVAAIATVADLGHAAVLTSLSASAPSGLEIMASQTGASGGLSWYNTGAGSLRDVGQSFLATSDFTLDKITLMLGGSFNSTSATSNFTLTLYSTASLTTSPATATTVSAQTGTFAFSAGSGGDGTFLTFDIADVVLTAGTYYTFMLSLNDASANNSLTVKQNTSSAYSDGYRWLYDGTSYTSSSGADLTFYAMAPVPELSTTMLLTTSLGLLALIRRKRA